MRLRYALPLACLLLTACAHRNTEKDIGTVSLRSSREDRTREGTLYTPSTQSLLRTHSWLEDVKTARLSLGAADNGTVLLADQNSRHYIKITNVPLDYLSPRLHYRPANPPDAFDALNLMLAEYSRNGLSVPPGRPGDAIPHYETNLTENVPWKLVADYQFVPNPDYKPQRVSVINNCLRPGLWELNAEDRSGEVYHSWFDMPLPFYYDLVGRVNGVKPDFARASLEWREQGAKIDLDRLRSAGETLGTVDVATQDDEVGFSSQDSRRKLYKHYALYEKSGELTPPSRLSDYYTHPVTMSAFIEPGIYSYTQRNKFDYSFLAEPVSASVQFVEPKTSYSFNSPGSRSATDQYIEMNIDLGRNERMIVGNLPLSLLVKQEDFILQGFGVGIFEPAGLAERRKLLVQGGPHPSYAYLAEQNGKDLVALNTHRKGIEQIFIRSHPDDATPYWEVTITSYERIADLIRYKVTMPKALWEKQRLASQSYIPPVYFTYRDDNTN